MVKMFAKVIDAKLPFVNALRFFLEKSVASGATFFGGEYVGK